MDGLTFVSELVKALSWPLLVLVFILVMRRPLGNLISFIERLKYKDFELQFRRQLQTIKEEVPVELQLGEERTSEEVIYIEIAQKSPRAAISEVWRKIELVAINKLRHLLSEEEQKSRKLSALYLEHSGALTPAAQRLLRDLYHLRNQAVHAPDFAVSLDDALEYIHLAKALTKQIDAISELPKVKLTALTLLIMEINRLIDTGKYNDISISDIYSAIQKRNIFGYLKERAGDDIDLSWLVQGYRGFEEFYSERLEQLYNCYSGDERKKWGVQNLGLCLLLAWTNEIVQEGGGWYPNE